MVAEAPIPIFEQSSVKPALAFQALSGKLRSLRAPPRVQPSRASELRYLQAINQLLEQLRTLVQERVVPLLPAIVANAPNEITDARHDVGEILEEAIRDLKIAFALRAPIEEIARRAGNETEARNRTEQQRIVQTVLGIRPELGEPWLEQLMAQFARDNAKLVSKVGDDFIDRLELTISSKVREGLRPEEIAKVIEADFVRKEGLESGKARNRAKLIARDQVASLQGDITRVRQTRIGVRRYTWRTSADERVRDTHRARNGKVFEWGRPIEPQLRAQGLKVDTIDGHPGKPINCRCYAEPVLQDLVPDLPAI